jgi:hypothetical protein
MAPEELLDSRLRSYCEEGIAGREHGIMDRFQWKGKYAFFRTENKT